MGHLPDWHPTDDRIVFQLPTDVSQPSDEADVAVVDLANSEPVVLTHFGDKGGWAIQPTWAPDGEGIWFVAEDLVRTHPNAAWINADGTGLERMIDEYVRTHPRQQPGSYSP